MTPIRGNDLKKNFQVLFCPFSKNYKGMFLILIENKDLKHTHPNVKTTDTG